MVSVALSTIISALYNDSLVGGKSLEIVSLQDNLLVHVDTAVFSRHPAIRIIRLGGNRLSSLPATLFSACRHLQVLDLHANRLTGAPPDNLFYHVHSLLSLNVSNNRLTSAKLGTGFRYVTQLADIDLSGRQSFCNISATTLWHFDNDRPILANLEIYDLFDFTL